MSDPYSGDAPPTTYVSPYASGVTTLTTFTYAGTIDSITNLFAWICWDHGVAAALPSAMPILILVHGYTGTAYSFADVDLARYASKGFFVVSIGLRAKNGASGTTDASAREIQDIVDAVAAVRATYASIVSPTVAVGVGYSGGGGNVLSCLVKVPELFAALATFFPVLDYGWLSDGWYQNNPAQAPGLLDTDIGVRSTHEAEYRARYVGGAVPLMMATFGAGAPHLDVLADTADAILANTTQRRLIAGLVSAGISTDKYAYRESTVGSTYRWYHDYPQGQTDLIQGEAYFVRRLREATPVTMPSTGTVQVLGWIRFGTVEIWLGEASSPRTTGGLNRTASLTYNSATGVYRLTPELGVTHVYAKHGASVAPAFSSSRTVIVTPSTGTVSQIDNDLDGAPVNGWAAHAVRATRTAPTSTTLISAARATTWYTTDRRSHTAL